MQGHGTASNAMQCHVRDQLSTAWVTNNHHETRSVAHSHDIAILFIDLTGKFNGTPETEVLNLRISSHLFTLFVKHLESAPWFAAQWNPVPGPANVCQNENSTVKGKQSRTSMMTASGMLMKYTRDLSKHVGSNERGWQFLDSAWVTCQSEYMRRIYIYIYQLFPKWLWHIVETWWRCCDCSWGALLGVLQQPCWLSLGEDENILTSESPRSEAVEVLSCSHNVKRPKALQHLTVKALRIFKVGKEREREKKKKKQRERDFQYVHVTECVMFSTPRHRFANRSQSWSSKPWTARSSAHRSWSRANPPFDSIRCSTSRFFECWVSLF